MFSGSIEPTNHLVSMSNWQLFAHQNDTPACTARLFFWLIELKNPASGAYVAKMFLQNIAKNE